MSELSIEECAIQLSVNGRESNLKAEEVDAYTNSLRLKVVSSLMDQGFDLDETGIKVPDHSDKELLRKLHSAAVQHKVTRGSALRSKELTLIKRIASAEEVIPEQIYPFLVEVMPDSFHELLFRYAALHWSIPVSSGYGRRIRFLVLDRQNNKLIGIIGLGDPVFALGARDRWVGWNTTQRKSRLRHVLDAYVLGAVPPYSKLLGGKLVAMLAASNEVRESFERKYAAKTSLISEVKGDARVALLSTTSALGRSSIYNRVRFWDRLLFEPVGYTTGSGEFHFSNELYVELLEFAETHCKPTAKNKSWGTGFRSKREVVRKALQELGLPLALQYHGVQRQVYVVPLASNARDFLQGDADTLEYFCDSADALFEYFRERWLLPRAMRTGNYREFDPKSFLLWHDPDQLSNERKS